MASRAATLDEHSILGVALIERCAKCFVIEMKRGVSSVLRCRSDIDQGPTCLLALWDFTTCAATGAAWVAACRGGRQPWPRIGAGVMPGASDILIGSLIAVAVLRGLEAAAGGRSMSSWGLVLRAERGCFCALALLGVIGLALQAGVDRPLKWRVSWFALFAAHLALSRLVHTAWFGALRDRHAADLLALSPDCGWRARRPVEAIEMIGPFADARIAPAALPDEGGSETPFPLDGEAGESELDGLAPDDSLDADAADVVDGLPGLSPQLVRSGDPESGAPRDQPARHRRLLVKHLFDKVAAFILLVLLAPLLVAIAGAVAVTSDGPVLLCEAHLGLHGSKFILFRFRTSACPAWGMPRPWHTRYNDPRCTRLGRALRAWNLDELPQLWNVLRGEMSLVGPRPEARQQSGLDRAGSTILAEYAQRYMMRPGMTGWAQIHGLHGARRTAERLRQRLSYDIWYIENWSLGLDFRILALTPFRLGRETVA